MCCTEADFGERVVPPNVESTGPGEDHDPKAKCHSQDVFEEGGCPKCGCNLLGHANPDGTWNDGDSLICDGCNIVAWVACDDDGAIAEWDDPPNAKDKIRGPTNDRRQARQGSAPQHRLVGRIPHAHKKHRSNCGCWDGKTHEQIVECPCGAAYRWVEVITFIDFECYDCHSCSADGNWITYYPPNAQITGPGGSHAKQD